MTTTEIKKACRFQSAPGSEGIRCNRVRLNFGELWPEEPIPSGAIFLPLGRLAEILVCRDPLGCNKFESRITQDGDLNYR